MKNVLKIVLGVTLSIAAWVIIVPLMLLLAQGWTLALLVVIGVVVTVLYRTIEGYLRG